MSATYITGLYIDQHGNLRQPGSKAPIWGMGIPVFYGQTPTETDIWAIPQTYFTLICPDKNWGNHPDDRDNQNLAIPK